jgi:hypothetical protein
VRPNARSSISFSSSSGSGILSYRSGSSTITWQVEQAQEPPQAPKSPSQYMNVSSEVAKISHLPFPRHWPVQCPASCHLRILGSRISRHLYRQMSH